MKIIIPMAGMGKRMRPHTLTTPKPLIKFAGKTIVEHLIYEISTVTKEKIDEINFVIGDFGEEVEMQLKKLAEKIGARPVISYQEEPLGTAHAVYCAKISLEGNVIVAFADTLFKAEFTLDEKFDGIIWTKKVDNPQSFGVVQKNNQNVVTGFYEKPKEFISDEAIIGIYYFKKGEDLAKEIKYLLDNKLMGNGEYQLTDALERMKEKDNKFSTGVVQEWYDCGKKDATVDTNQQILKHLSENELEPSEYKMSNSVIIPPCYIGKNVEISNSVVGPYVSVEEKTKIQGSLIKNSIIQSNTIVRNCIAENSMIGHHVNVEGQSTDLSIGDYTNIKF
jgi:glucose-1-phosphate thymidylyltransferase